MQITKTEKEIREIMPITITPQTSKQNKKGVILPKLFMNSSIKPLRKWRKKLKIIPESEKIFIVHKLSRLIMWKWSSY